MTSFATNSAPLHVSLKRAPRLMLFACISIVCYIVAAVIVGFIAYKAPGSSSMMRIAAVLQDVLMFITPAIVTALLVTRLPATLLCIDRRPSIMPTVFGLGALYCSVPAMNALIYWNNKLSLPQSLHAVEVWMRSTEDLAQKSIETLLGGTGVANLLMGVLIVGVLAALSEELFFRGALQRLIAVGRGNVHVAVWGAAIVFSAIHMQFYGFFPRLMLGVFFGYALVWTGSLWVPIVLHAANNITYVVSRWMTLSPDGTPAPQDLGDGNLLIHTASIVATAVLVYCMYRSARKSTQAST